MSTKKEELAALLLSKYGKTEKEIRDEWKTPKLLASQFVSEYDLLLDVAASKENAVCESYFDRPMNALEQEWDKPWWCNPPFSNILPWVEKGLFAPSPGLMLVPSRMASDWMKKICDANQSEAARNRVDIFFFRGRVAYDPPVEEIEKSSPNFDSVLLHFSPNSVGLFTGCLCPKTGVFL